MPAERTLDQRLDAIERRLDDPGSDQAHLAGSQATDRPPERDARPVNSTTAGAAGSARDAPDGGVDATAHDPAGPAEKPPVEASAAGSEDVAEDPSSTTDPTDIESRLDAVEAELAELQAGMQALRGYVGNIEHVNESVERRANAALAAVERLEAAPTSPPSLASVSEPGAREGHASAARDGDDQGGRGGDEPVPPAADEQAADGSGDADSGETGHAARAREFLDRLAALG